MARPQLSFVTLDVFTTTRYTGNPLAIVNVPRSTLLTQTQKQRIATEFNLSETVFLHEQTEEDREVAAARIDIFTPYSEIPFAGHPTVGTANYLRGQVEGSTARSKDVKTLQTKAGPMRLTLAPEIRGMQISVAHDVRVHAQPFADTTFGQHPVVSIVKGMTFILAQQASLEELGRQTRHLIGADEANAVAHEALDEGYRTGIVGSYFFVDLGRDERNVRNLRTRMLRMREDPATGSAASALTSYLSLREGKAASYKYHVTQGVEMGRRSEIFVDVRVKDKADGDGVEIEEVLLSGSAVFVMQGTLAPPEA